MPAPRDLKIERPRGTLTDQVTDELTRRIRAGEHAPDSRLPSEKELAGRFGVSRTVVREAVSRLKSEGLVESHQGKGAFVRRRGAGAPFRLDRGAADSLLSVIHIIELRRGLEAEAAALAAARRSSAQLAEIREALAELRRVARAGGDGVDADAGFHRAIARATGNPHYLALWDFIGQFLHDAIRLTRAHEARHAPLAEQVTREHEAMAAAIARRDPRAARAAALRHLEMVVTRITSADLDFWESERGRAARPPAPRQRPRAARRG